MGWFEGWEGGEEWDGGAPGDPWQLVAAFGAAFGVALGSAPALSAEHAADCSKRVWNECGTSVE